MFSRFKNCSKQFSLILGFILFASDGSARGEFLVKRIAHAGGAIHDYKYTSSIEALDQNFAKGFEYFELDFSFNNDTLLECVSKHVSPYTPCTLQTLANWMQKHPSTKIIPDIKDERVLLALNQLNAVLPDYKDRIIPQIYDPNDYEKVRKVGYGQVIWTLYRYQGSNQAIIEWVQKFDGIFAVTMPVDRAKSGLSVQLKQLGISVFVHTINTREEFEDLKKLGVKEVYSDILF